MRALTSFIKRENSLRIELIEDERKEVQEIFNQEGPSDGKFLQVIEYQRCNGWDLLLPEEVGALTPALILTDDAYYNDDGDLIDVDTVYWDEQYQVRDALEYLLRDGYVIFPKGD